MLLILFLLLTACAGAQTAETEPPVFRVGVSLVTIDAKVTGRNGRDIANLNANDFVIYDEGERRTVSNFGRESTPVEVLLVIDASPEMRPYLLDLTPHVMEALGPLRPGDRAGAILFGATSEVIAPLTTDLADVPRKVVNNLYKDRYGRGTLVNEALADAAAYLKREPAKGRRTVIVITNNRGVRSAVQDADVVRALQGADAVLNAIVIGEDAGPRTVLSAHAPGVLPPDVYRYARETGGDVVQAQDPAAALRQVIAAAMTRYSLQFPAPSEANGYRRLRVELSSAAHARYPGATVQTRAGYEVPK